MHLAYALTLSLWKSKYYSDGFAGIYKLIGNVKDIYNMPSNKKKLIETEDKTKEQLAHELELARAEIVYLKKLRALIQSKTKKSQKS